MNNIKKIGLSALAGSLAMVSANAVDYTMSGGLTAVATTQDDPNTAANSGKGLGMKTDLSFSASGELDNGFTIDYVMAVDTAGALSNTSSQMKVGMGSLGSFHINNEGGSYANAIDDMTPAAYAGPWDGISAGTNPTFFGVAVNGGSVTYRIPAQEFEGLTLNAGIDYDPNQGVGGATGGSIDTTADSASAVVVQLGSTIGDGNLSVGAGYEVLGNTATAIAEEGQHVTGYIKYENKGLSMAYQEVYGNTKHNAAAEGADKEGRFMSVAYTMGDLTVSAAKADYDVAAVSDTAALVTQEQTAIQAAYVMGAMTVSVSMAETDNLAGISAQNYNENTLAVSFAF